MSTKTKNHYSVELPPAWRHGQSIARAITDVEEWTSGGYAKDLALLNESDPGGKISATADVAEWKVTIIDGGSDALETIVISDSLHGGYLVSTTNNADNDALEYQKNGAPYRFSANRRVVFEAKVRIGDVSLADWFVGLAIPDTAVMAGVTDYVGFFIADGTAGQTIQFGMAKNGSAAEQGAKTAATTTTSGETDSSTSVAVVDDTDVVLQFIVNGLEDVRAYVNGQHKVTLTVLKDTDGTVRNIPDDVSVTKSFSHRNGSAATSVLSQDYIAVISDR